MGPQGRTHPQDRRALKHLGHKGRNTLELTVARANSREDAVKDWDRCLVGWDKATDLRHECDDADLPDVG